MKLTWMLLLQLALAVEGVVTSVVGSVVFDVLVGQPVSIAPTVRHAVEDHLPFWGLLVVGLGLLILLAMRQTRREQSQSDARTARVGAGASHSAATTGDNSPVTITANRDGVLNEVYLRRNRPHELRTTMGAIGELINAGDPYWQRTAGTDGTFTLTPRSPEAHERRPLRVQLRTETALGEPTLLDLLHRAAEDQQAFTINEGAVRHFQSFLGDDLMHDSQEEGVVRTEITFQVSPLEPPISYIMRVRETGSELRNLVLGLFVLPDGRYRLTNCQDEGAPVVVWIDFAIRDTEGEGRIVDEVMVETGGCQVTITTRPVPNRTARHLLALYDVLRSLRNERWIELEDYATSEVQYAFYGALSHSLTADEEAFADALAAVQRTFPTTTFRILDTPTPDEVSLVFRVAQIVSTGILEAETHTISFTMAPAELGALLSYADADGVLHLDDDAGRPRRLRVKQACEDIILFAAPLDLGESWTDLCPLRLARNRRDLQDDIDRSSPDHRIDVELVPADPVNCTFVRRYTRYDTDSRQAS